MIDHAPLIDNGDISVTIWSIDFIFIHNIDLYVLNTV